MRDIPAMREPIEKIAERAGGRRSWWAEPSPNGDGTFLVRSGEGVVADGLTQRQAMMIAAEYNLARADAEALAKQRFRVRAKRSA